MESLRSYQGQSRWLKHPIVGIYELTCVMVDYRFFSLMCSLAGHGLPYLRSTRTMTSADFWWFSCPSLDRILSVLSETIRPPQERTQSFPPPICFIYSVQPSGRKSFVLYCTLTQLYLAFYVGRIPQTEDLPLASFRFHVTMDTLALS